MRSMNAPAKVLIDTHTFLWMAAEPEKLPARAREICETAELVFSVASVWEISIKWEIGRLPLPVPPHDFLTRELKRGGVTTLPISPRAGSGRFTDAASRPVRPDAGRAVSGRRLAVCDQRSRDWGVRGKGALGVVRRGKTSRASPARPPEPSNHSCSMVRSSYRADPRFEQRTGGIAESDTP